jgi:alkylation response protein AidB-like acyl-CoA dehydrogenase
MPGPAGSLIKLSIAGTVIRHSDIAMEIGGPLTIADADEVPALGVRFIGRQGVAIGGGTNEMQRNTIGEKLLGLPRDVQNDDVPFRQVRTNRLSSKPGDGQ